MQTSPPQPTDVARTPSPSSPSLSLKPGIQTTEFWLCVAMLVAALVAQVAGVIDADWAVTASGVAVAVYTWCRRSIKLETLVVERASRDDA